MIARLIFALATALGLMTSHAAGAESLVTYDVVVYGGTSAGITAAIQADRKGKSVVLIEPTHHLGGLTSSGLGMTDTGKHEVIGGLAREFYRRIKKHYENATAWKWEKRADFRWWADSADALWRFEPAVAESVFRLMLSETKVAVVEGERLNLSDWGGKSGTVITDIRMESGRTFRGRMFIDATYEGDLMAKAGVSYRVGREANAEFGESLNGVQVAQATKHQFLHDVDPWRVPGDRQSGLLPTVQVEVPGPHGSADRRIQAYCFRLCLTDIDANRLPWMKPERYDPLRYEILRRYFAAGWLWKEMWNGHHPVPNHKTDTNNSGGFSSDHIGANHAYPDGDYVTRAAIFKDHEDYQKGLWYFLASDPGVPVAVRDEVNRWGLAKDEFVYNGGWPHALYIREARRLVSDYIHTEMDCRRTRETPQPVGMGSYGIDSHNIQRYVDARGTVRNEGDIQVPLAGPYPISYLSIRPRATECTNLLVPICCAATHIGYGSIRMEPVFMILGESTATAASLALDAGTPVQDVSYPKLRELLLADGQILSRNEPAEKTTR